MTNSPKALALLCQHFYPEMISTGMHMTELATKLAAKGHLIQVYCARPAYRDSAPAQDPVSTRMIYQGVSIVHVPAIGNPRRRLLSRGLFALSYLLATAWAVWRDRRTLRGVIATTNPPFIGLVAVWLKRWLRWPFLLIVYDVYPDIAVQLGVMSNRSPITWLWHRITRLVLRQAASIVVIGRDMAQIVRRKLAAEEDGRIHLIPNWSDEQRIKPIPPHQNPFVQEHHLQDYFVIQYSGRMGRTHNLEPLLEAAALLQDEAVMFQFVGDGAKRQLLAEMAQTLMLKNVQFLPYQPIETLAQTLSAAHLAVVCLDERFTGLSVPSKTYGIMASGRPILAFLDPAGEIGQVIRETECGLILPSPTGEMVAAMIRELLSERDRLTQMGENGRIAFQKQYTLSIAAARYDQLIRDCFNDEK
jgi:glycosyltransferase involved in cell wall biosynthesis